MNGAFPVGSRRRPFVHKPHHLRRALIQELSGVGDARAAQAAFARDPANEKGAISVIKPHDVRLAVNNWDSRLGVGPGRFVYKGVKPALPFLRHRAPDWIFVGAQLLEQRVGEVELRSHGKVCRHKCAG